MSTRSGKQYNVVHYVCKSNDKDVNKRREATPFEGTPFQTHPAGLLDCKVLKDSMSFKHTHCLPLNPNAPMAPALITETGKMFKEKKVCVHELKKFICYMFDWIVYLTKYINTETCPHCRKMAREERTIDVQAMITGWMTCVTRLYIHPRDTAVILDSLDHVIHTLMTNPSTKKFRDWLVIWLKPRVSESSCSDLANRTSQLCAQVRANK